MRQYKWIGCALMEVVGYINGGGGIGCALMEVVGYINGGGSGSINGRRCT
jgi:hypothetical protein